MLKKASIDTQGPCVNVEKCPYRLSPRVINSKVHKSQKNNINHELNRCKKMRLVMDY